MTAFVICKGAYCAYEQPTPCPQHSTTTSTGASTIEACVCDATFYPTIGASADWCLPMPTGASCAGAGMTSGCTCLSRWTPEWWNDVLHCKPPECSPGSYFPITNAAVLDGSGACVPCPAVSSQFLAFLV
jgi:hypothetical protein